MTEHVDKLAKVSFATLKETNFTKFPNKVLNINKALELKLKTNKQGPGAWCCAAMTMICIIHINTSLELPR